MSELLPLCLTGKCPGYSVDEQASEKHQNDCKKWQKLILDAGGAGFLETYPCPSSALFEILDSDHEISTQIKQQLGLSSIDPTGGAQ
jgi:hypothetical protein